MSETWRVRWPAVAVILVFLAAGVLYTEAVPPWESPDEPWHLAYAEAVAGGRWPTPTDTYESHQPPLYYAAVATVLRIIDIRQVSRAPDNPWYPYAEAALWHVPGDPAVPLLRLVRTLTGFLGCLVVALAWASAHAVAPDDRLRPMLAALVVALLPQFVFISHAISNDVAAAVSGAVLVYGYVAWLARPDDLRRAGLVLLAGGALAVSTKVNVAPLLLVAPLCSVLAARRLRSGAHGHARLIDRHRAVWAPLVGLCAGVAVGSVALGFLAPDTLRRTLTDAAARGTSSVAAVLGAGELAAQALRTLSSSFARFGWLTIDLPTVGYVCAGVALFAAVAGLVTRWRGASCRERDAVVVAAAVCAVAAIAVARNLLADPQPQGRLLFPALSALAVVLATGWLWLAGRRLGSLAVVGVLVFGVLVNLYAGMVLLPGAFASTTGPLPPVDVRVMPPRREVVAELGGGTTEVAQSFRVSNADVGSVEVAVAYARGPGNVEVALRDGRGDVVDAATFALSDVVGNRWLALHVPSRYLCCSGTHTISLKLDDPEGRLGLWGTTDDVYADGSMVGTNGDLALVVVRRQEGATADPAGPP